MQHKEDGMVNRIIRAVSLDVHGGLFEKVVPGGRVDRVPETGRQHWAWCFSQAISEALGTERTFDPLRLWEAMTEVALRAPRVVDGRVMPQRHYYEDINDFAFAEVAPDLARSLNSRQRRRVARLVRRLHRLDQTGHQLYPDMRELVEWIRTMNLRLYLNTAQEDRRVNQLLEHHRVPRHWFDGVYTTYRLGFSKVRPEFWEKMLNAIRLEPQEVMVIGNNTVQDTYCTVVGIPALILDRDGVQGRYFTNRGDHLRGAQFLTRQDPLPPRAAFIGFERSPKQLQWWLQRMIAIPNAEQH